MCVLSGKVNAILFYANMLINHKINLPALWKDGGHSQLWCLMGGRLVIKGLLCVRNREDLLF